MIKIGVTGQSGFVGTHLINTLKLKPKEFMLIPFERRFFEDEFLIDSFVKQCDVIVHLAAVNRHNNDIEILKINTLLVSRLVDALNRTNSDAHVIMSSSTQEILDNAYGKSKKIGREALEIWANKSGGRFTGLIIPNVYGPFGHPFHNSVVATFCHQISLGEIPSVHKDVELKLIYVSELVNEIIHVIEEKSEEKKRFVAHTAQSKVSEILKTLNFFKLQYQDKGELPPLNTEFEKHLFSTYPCYMSLINYFPRKFALHADNRGSFVEIARHYIAGQTSYSTTNPNVTRGNHFHTRKIERFAVVQGEALIKLRRVGTEKVLHFYLSGKEPAYIDIPVWYTHNITNIGEDQLLTIFWINEAYNPSDPDTYIEEV